MLNAESGMARFRFSTQHSSFSIESLPSPAGAGEAGAGGVELARHPAEAVGTALAAGLGGAGTADGENGQHRTHLGLLTVNDFPKVIARYSSSNFSNAFATVR